MDFEEIVADIVAGKKTTEQVFGGRKFARAAWPDGDYLGMMPNPTYAARPILAIFRDEPWGAVSRNWSTADEDRQADDWYEIVPEETA